MRMPYKSLIGLASVAAMLLGASCGVEGPPMGRQANRVLYQWHDDEGPGRVSVHISLSDQIAEFERGGRDIGWCYVATGKEGHVTVPGHYAIMEKIEDKHSTLYGWFEDESGNVTDGDAKSSDRVPAGMVYVPAPMPYWMRLTSCGVGMHGGLIPEPGKPASHGCIRLPKAFVPLLYNSVSVGTTVSITNAPSHRSRMEIEAHPSEPVRMTSRRGVGRVSGVTYRDGLPVSFW